MFASIDSAVAMLERQIRKNKTKVGKKLRQAAFEEYDAIEKFEPEDDYDVVRSKDITLKPQSVEEAILQMNLLDHQFYMFLDSTSYKICVVYARKDGGYGVLIPETE